MTIVTISAQHGAGSRDVGRYVARELTLHYVDQAVLVDAARELGVDRQPCRQQGRTHRFTA